MEEELTLKQAVKTLEQELEKGTQCPCCRQFAKKYKRKLNSGMARILIHIYKRNKKQITFFHVNQHIRKKILQNSHDWPLLRYWGLIEPKIKEREDGSNRNGYYRITKKGKLFVERKITVPKHILMYNNKLQGFTQEITTIKESLGSKFLYSELMGKEIVPVNSTLDKYQ